MDGINKIIETAGKLGTGNGGSGSGNRGREEEKEDKDGQKQRNAKKDQEEKKDPLGDQKGSKGKEPDSPEKAKGKDPPENAKPPAAPKRPAAPKNALDVFYAKLPDKVREAVLNGDFDQVPEKYRDLVREWSNALAEKEKKEAERSGDEGR